MQKKLIALAVAGLAAAPAFAATSNVDVYGKLHAAVSVFQDEASNCNAYSPNNTGSECGTQFSSNASRIGFKGSEDLGAGMKALWQIESGLNLDEQSGTVANRNSFVGLSGGWGTALIGNHDTPLKNVGRAVDLFGDTMADSRNVVGLGSDTRTKNTVAYVSPDLGGFTVTAAYVSDLDTPYASTSTSGATAVGGSKGDADSNDAYNLSASYNNGPIYVGAAYGNGDGHENLQWDDQWRVAGSYAFGDFKVVAQYDQLDAQTSNASGDFDAWMVGGSYKMGNLTLKANYIDGNYDKVAAKDPQQWSIGADYALSKRTSVYGLYSDGENITFGKGAGDSDQLSNSTVGGNEDISVFSVGVVHNF